MSPPSFSCKWTNEKPKVPGFYWCECRGVLSGNIFKTVVQIYKIKPDEEFVIFADGEHFSYHDDRFLRWSNLPLQEPTE